MKDFAIAFAAIVVAMIWSAEKSLTDSRAALKRLEEAIHTDQASLPEVKPTVSEPTPGIAPQAPDMSQVSVVREPEEPAGRWVTVQQPIYGRFGRFRGYQTVQQWQGPQQRTTFGQVYSSCANGRCR